MSGYFEMVNDDQVYTDYEARVKDWNDMGLVIRLTILNDGTDRAYIVLRGDTVAGDEKFERSIGDIPIDWARAITDHKQVSEHGG